jgi:hypothetical protein
MINLKHALGVCVALDLEIGFGLVPASLSRHSTCVFLGGILGRGTHQFLYALVLFGYFLEMDAVASTIN